MSRVVVEYINKGDDKVTLSADEDVTYILVGLVADDPSHPTGLTKEIEIELKKEGVKAKILGLFLVGSGDVKIRTTQHHMASNTTSDLLFKSVLFGDVSNPSKASREGGRFDYKGLIKIEKPAQNSNAYQRNDNLLVSKNERPFDKLRVTTQPQLEILADEVRCTHGATTGRINKDELFYLQSRGLSQEQAKKLIVAGFIKDVLDKIPTGTEKQEIEKLVKKKLQELND